eukprot:349634-Chlamydomonas_euryale.AAC.8
MPGDASVPVGPQPIPQPAAQGTFPLPAATSGSDGTGAFSTSLPLMTALQGLAGGLLVAGATEQAEEGLMTPSRAGGAASGDGMGPRALGDGPIGSGDNLLVIRVRVSGRKLTANVVSQLLGKKDPTYGYRIQGTVQSADAQVSHTGVAARA